MKQLIIGEGITRVKFRLLEGVRDINYYKQDSGESHVFEILRDDTSAVQLHYHKNGSLDDPVLIDPIVIPQNATSGGFSAYCTSHCAFSVAASRWSSGSRAGVDSPIERMLEEWGRAP